VNSKSYKGGQITTSVGNEPAYDDDFERAVSVSGGTIGKLHGPNQGKQKEFIIKKMFKVPSNELAPGTPTIVLPLQ
jgi:hypothetical protein